MTRNQPPVAIVGMAVLLPGAADLEAYWQNLVNGVDAITDIPKHRLDLSLYDQDGASDSARTDRIYCRRGGFIDDLVEIDPTEFGMMPNSVTETEPDQLIALKVAAAAVADAGGAQRLPARDRIGVILGRGAGLSPGWVRQEQRFRTVHQIIHTLRELVPDLTPAQLGQVKAAFTAQVDSQGVDSVIGLSPALVAARIANRLDFRGPAYSVDAACAASLLAVDLAVGELTSRRCDLVVVGGVHHGHDLLAWKLLSQMRLLSPSQRMRPLDRAADGILASEGTVMVALKRLADAERAGDRIYAVILGTGVTSDGRGESLFKPEPERQALAQRRAWQAAGRDPAEPGSVGLLEACGAATPVGDEAELAALTRVFGPALGERAVIGSVKSMIGHTMQAAGIASLIKTALAVHHGVLLPTLGCEDPHPALAGTRFRPIDSAQPWELGGRGVRRAAVNAFGFGGVNVHVVVEQHRSTAGSPQPRGPVVVNEPEAVLRLAAQNPAGIVALLDGEDVATEADGCRLGVVDPTRDRLAFARRVVTKGAPWRGGNDVWFSPQPLLRTHPGAGVGFVFPGLDLESTFEPGVADVAACFGLPMPDISAEDLGRRGAAVISVSRLLDRALRRLGIAPDVVAGYSVGELAAMASAGMFSDADFGAYLTSFDQFMESFDLAALGASGVKTATVSCGADRIADAVAACEGMVVSHDGSPQHSIVCGPAAAVDELVSWLRGHNVLAKVLPTTVGLHTPFMTPYLPLIREAIARLRLHPPAVPIWSATSAAPYPRDDAGVRQLLEQHLVEPVRFRALVEAMYAAGTRVFVQVGSGWLGSLIDDTLRGREHLAITAHTALRSGLDQLRRVVTALWVEGCQLPPVDVGPVGVGPVGVAVPRRHSAKLGLSTSLVSLNGAAPVLARSSSRLDQFAAELPLAGELAELLRETADSAAAVLSARTASRKASRE